MIILVIIIFLAFIEFFIYRYYINFVKFGQYIREDAPEHHKSKQGTPTAGGLVFTLFILLLSFIINLIYSLPLYSVFLILVMGNMFIGLYDDLMKIINKRNLGLRARDKIFLHFVIAVVVFFILKGSNYFIDQYGISYSSLGFVSNYIDLGVFYFIFLYFLVSGVSNSTNLTDGLDGLLSSLSIFTFLGYLVIFLIFNNLSIVYLIVGIIFFIGVFLYYNFPRAKLFMGDTGSLVVGALFVYFSIISKTEVYLLFLGYIYFLVTLSVILQVLYFKITKGRRLFSITPLHHHFELMGFNEKAILLRFNIVNIIFIIIGLFYLMYKFMEGGIFR